MAFVLKYSGVLSGIPDFPLESNKRVPIGRDIFSADSSASEDIQKVEAKACFVEFKTDPIAVEVTSLAKRGSIRIFPGDGSVPRYLSRGSSTVLQVGDSLDLVSSTPPETDEEEEESDCFFILIADEPKSEPVVTDLSQVPASRDTVPRSASVKTPFIAEEKTSSLAQESSRRLSGMFEEVAVTSLPPAAIATTSKSAATVDVTSQPAAAAGATASQPSATGGATTSQPAAATNAATSQPSTGNFKEDPLKYAITTCMPLVTSVERDVLDSRQAVADEQRLIHWRDEVKQIKAKMDSGATIIGVVGTTGAGKSTLVNTLLKERALLPTNGMRACTAAVIQMRHHDLSVYKAAITFLSVQEWKKQVVGLLKDLEVSDENGVPQIELRNYEDSNSKSDHAVAQSKLEAVLGQKTLRHLFNQCNRTLTVDAVLSVQNRVTSYMKQTAPTVIQDHCSKQFANKLQGYVDSTGDSTQLQTWPVVKQATVWHNWPLLRCGTVLVDLPGVADANAARGSIARDYLKRCNVLLIAAPIHRAVDDGVAKDLLGAEFRRQMMMDGQYANIAFCATKSDRLNAQEILKDLKPDLQKYADYAGIDIEAIAHARQVLNQQEARLQQLGQDLKKCTRQFAGPRTKVNNLRKKINLVEGLLEEPRSMFHKLKLHQDDVEDGDEDGDGEEDAAADEADDVVEDVEVMDVVALDDAPEEQWTPSVSRDAQGGAIFPTPKQLQKLPPHQLRGWKAAMWTEHGELLSAAQKARAAVLATEGRVQAQEMQVQKASRSFKRIAALLRNAYSKLRLKEDFRQGMRDMVQTAAGSSASAEAAEALDLPVFTVSAVEASKLELSGSRNDGIFEGLKDTDLAALRDHILQATMRDHIVQARQLSSKLSALLASMAATLYHAGTMGAQARLRMKECFVPASAALKARLASQPAEALASMRKDILTDALMPNISQGNAQAEAGAYATVSGWRREYPWATYKATVRPHRLGEYTSRAKGEISFNGQLIEPMLDRIQMEWDRSFNTAAPAQIKDFSRKACKAVEMMVDGMMVELGEEASKHEALQHMCQQLVPSVKTILADIEEQANLIVSEKQRDLSRELKDFVQDRMTEVYNRCSEESGPGQYNRMNTIMTDSVQRLAPAIFKELTDQAVSDIESLLAEVGKRFKMAAEKVERRVRNDVAALASTKDVDPAVRRAAVQKLLALHEPANRACATLEAPAVPTPALDMSKLDELVTRSDSVNAMEAETLRPQQSSEPATTPAGASSSEPQGMVQDETKPTLCQAPSGLQGAAAAADAAAPPTMDAGQHAGSKRPLTGEDAASSEFGVPTKRVKAEQ
ncbi:hypothetical protein CYMTET_45273 [Cymbomonas tetramitiformis]|uniref:Uncharacterized protein n=1 Tax=Cymbomonas tetramitiformis TaxID=36881 RepID=A0AAE0EZU6_9CHLO|nr:hypothetical protein CYMTET_45273 [Cymbomonas tetramitiformis]